MDSVFQFFDLGCFFFLLCNAIGEHFVLVFIIIFKAIIQLFAIPNDGVETILPYTFQFLVPDNMKIISDWHRRFI